MENPEALKKFFDLMLSVLRIINSVVLKNRNDQTQKLALTFLTENRFFRCGRFQEIRWCWRP